MKLAEFFKKYNLHDSIIEAIEYIPGEMKIIINLELCNWKQSFYESFEPEMMAGLLVLLGVTYFQTEPNVLSIDGSEILDVCFMPAENAVKIVLTNLDDVGVIEVKADRIFWEQATE